MKLRFSIIIIIAVFSLACKNNKKSSDEVGTAPERKTPITDSLPFPTELVQFRTISESPVFKGTGKNTWDKNIRERGYILKEEDMYHMWYTGFETESTSLALGYATSEDGISWTRYANNPIFNESWTEDMMVLKVDSTYHMFAEGKNDIAHRLTSLDKINWTDHGSLNIRKFDGSPLSGGPYGTPTAWRENDIWYLFYERGDLGIWLATSEDLKVWTNIQDDPVIAMGPEIYDQFGLAVNQIVKYNGWYYAYYHGTALEDWSEWSTNVAASKDLVNWKKYKQNPIMGKNTSSGILVPDDENFLLYTMHKNVEIHEPRSLNK